MGKQKRWRKKGRREKKEGWKKKMSCAHAPTPHEERKQNGLHLFANNN